MGVMMRRKFNFKSKYIFFACAGLCVATMIFTFISDKNLHTIRSAFGDVVTPMQSGINQVGNWISEKTEVFTTVKKLLAENKELQEQVDTLSSQNKILMLDQYELDSLRELYELDEKYSEYPKVAARVITKDGGNWYNVFKIDKGTNDGLAVGMNVMAGDGLVGIITEVGHNWASVRSIIDDASSVSGMFLDTSDTCIINGNLELLDNGYIEIEDISKSADIKEGYEVVTSRISSNYLPGILIGTVSGITTDSSNLRQTGYLTPAVDFDKLDTVLVITTLKESEY